MSNHVVDLLPDLLDQRLEGPALAAVRAHLASCAACRAELADLEEVWGLLATSLPPQPPSSGLRDRLMADTTRGRLYHMAPALAAFHDLREADARELLDRADDPAAWGPFSVPGVRYMRVKGGPAVAHRDNALIHIPAGTFFPRHRHDGTETTLVITGRMRDEDGQLFTAGDVSPRYRGTDHTFTAEGHVHLFCGLAFEGPCSWVR